MAKKAEDPLLGTLFRLSDALDTREVARRWYENYLATLGRRAVVDTANQGTIASVHRRAAGSEDMLPLPSAEWTVVDSAGRLLDGLALYDGRQKVQILYGQDGRVADRSINGMYPGRLVELARVISRAKEPVAESVAFVAGLGDERYGPGRVHYPVPAPGGVLTVWNVGLMGCRRALFDGRMDATARYLVADGLEGRAVGSGPTRGEAQAAYESQVARALPRQRRTIQTITDDYDDDGNLIRRGELPPELRAPLADEEFAGDADESEASREPWRGEAGNDDEDDDPEPRHIELFHGVFRGPRSDAPPVPRRPECVPHVVLPLEPSPETSPTRGRWERLLGALGVTRHAVRIEEPGAFVLVGSDLLGLVSLEGLRVELDRLDGDEPLASGSPEHRRFVRFSARDYRWSPATQDRPAGLVFASASCGPRFEAGGLDGDALQAQVRRQRKVLRPVD